MIMQFRLFLLLIGLCVISCHQATAENEEVPVPKSRQDTESKDALASRAEDSERNDNGESDFNDEGDNEDEHGENEEPNEVSEDDENEGGLSDESPNEYELIAKDPSARPFWRRRRRRRRRTIYWRRRRRTIYWRRRRRIYWRRRRRFFYRRRRVYGDANATK